MPQLGHTTTLFASELEGLKHMLLTSLRGQRVYVGLGHVGDVQQFAFVQAPGHQRVTHVAQTLCVGVQHVGGT